MLQQAAGINTVMYYTPAILELAGFRDKRSALLIAMLPASGVASKLPLACQRACLCSPLQANLALCIAHLQAARVPDWIVHLGGRVMSSANAATVTTVPALRARTTPDTSVPCSQSMRWGRWWACGPSTASVAGEGSCTWRVCCTMSAMTGSHSGVLQAFNHV